MITFQKNVETLDNVLNEFAILGEDCDVVRSYKEFFTDGDVKSYENMVLWPLHVCTCSVPSPFKFQNHSINIGPSFFSIRFPSNIGVGVRVISTHGHIEYQLSVYLYNTNEANDAFIKQTKEYETLINADWKIKEYKVH